MEKSKIVRITTIDYAYSPRIFIFSQKISMNSKSALIIMLV